MGNFWALIGLAKVAVEAVIKLAAFAQDYLAKRQADKEKAKIKAQVEIYHKANEIEDDKARIKAKADAIAKLNSLN